MPNANKVSLVPLVWLPPAAHELAVPVGVLGVAVALVAFSNVVVEPFPTTLYLIAVVRQTHHLASSKRIHSAVGDFVTMHSIGSVLATAEHAEALEGTAANSVSWSLLRDQQTALLVVAQMKFKQRIALAAVFLLLVRSLLLGVVATAVHFLSISTLGDVPSQLELETFHSVESVMLGSMIDSAVYALLLVSALLPMNTT